MDKSSFGDGPWQSEPDKEQWVDPKTGLSCILRRNNSGALCGYVGVPEGHPWYMKGYPNIDAVVHGGLTFAGRCQKGEHAICHVVEPGEPDNVWWLGFDCAHGFDYLPALNSDRMPLIQELSDYRDVKYVKQQCARLAKQVLDARNDGGQKYDETETNDP